MRWFIYRIVFPTRRESVFASQRHIFASPSHRRGSSIRNVSAYTPPISCHVASRNITLRSNNRKPGYLDIEIIGKEQIKPASPTPHNLRTYTFSMLDQLMSQRLYTSVLFFFSPNNQLSTVLNDVISERTRLLKLSLSKTLVSFYPLAGKIKDNLQIECNDDGVYYVEARVNIQLSNFLVKPEYELLNRLYPLEPDSMKLWSKTDVLMVQVSIFDCGGIAIGLNASHKIFDGVSVSTFIQAWAVTARQSSEETIIKPSFISSSLFRPIPNLSVDDLSLSVSKSSPQKMIKEHSYVTNRFVFDYLALAALKTKVATHSSFTNPSLVKAVMGLLWKSAIETSNVIYGVQKKSIIGIPVNLRTKCSPPLPPYTLGNLYWMTYAMCAEDCNPNLPLLVSQIRNAIATINNDLVEGMKGEDRFLKLMGPIKDLKKLNYDTDSTIEGFVMSSICKTGYYEADYGWGKPIWTCFGRGRRDFNSWGNTVFLMDSKSGNGIEAWVTMKEEDMAIFEKNSELIAYASINPSPLGS